MKAHERTEAIPDEMHSSNSEVRLDGCRVLALMGRAPWPLDDGWRMRSGNLILGLARRGAQVDLIAFGDPDEAVPDRFAEALHRTEMVRRSRSYAIRDLIAGVLLGTPFPVLNYRDDAFARRVEQLSGTAIYDLLLVEDIVMAQYARHARARTRFLDMHNVESHLMARYATLERRWPHKVYARLTATKLARYERALSGQFDATLVCSTDDRARLAAGRLNGNVVVVPNGIDSAYFHEGAAAPDNGAIAFVGSMDYHANISGVLHFVNDVLPHIHAELPGLVTYIVGKNPPAEIRRLSSERVVVTGAVPDVRPFLAAAAVSVVPLLVGGGTRLKILESMAMGKAIVSTTVGAEGIPVSNGDTLVLADDPVDFAREVIDLVRDPGRAEAMGHRARQYVVRDFEWDAIVERIAASYFQAIGKPTCN